MMDNRDLEKAALCGEPSYVWRAGQERRLQMVLKAAGNCIQGRILENGCGVGVYLERLVLLSQTAVGLESDFLRAQEALKRAEHVLCAVGEALPFPNDHFDTILSHEVLEHVQDDRAYIEEMVRSLRRGGRIIIFAPNRGYPFETHGAYLGSRYVFGLIPLVNYMPGALRGRLCPHVRAYTVGGIRRLFADLPGQLVAHRQIYAGYDNIASRHPRLAGLLRRVSYGMEGTPLGLFGLSHFLVLEKAGGRAG